MCAGTWDALPNAEFNEEAQAEAALESSTAIEGALFERVETAQGARMLPSALLLQMTCADEWRLFNGYEPAPKGEQWATPPLDFTVSVGDMVSVHASARLLPLRRQGKAKLPGQIQTFGGVVVGRSVRYVVLHSPSGIYLTALTPSIVRASDQEVSPPRLKCVVLAPRRGSDRPVCMSPVTD